VREPVCDACRIVDRQWAVPSSSLVAAHRSHELVKDEPLTTTNRSTEDPAFLAFLTERLSEERVKAASRSATVNPEDAEQTERGLRMLDELVRDLQQGRTPDRMTIGLLTMAYADRPDFRREWSRWAE